MSCECGRQDCLHVPRLAALALQSGWFLPLGRLSLNSCGVRNKWIKYKIMQTMYFQTKRLRQSVTEPETSLNVCVSKKTICIHKAVWSSWRSVFLFVR